MANKTVLNTLNIKISSKLNDDETSQIYDEIKKIAEELGIKDLKHVVNDNVDVDVNDDFDDDSVCDRCGKPEHCDVYYDKDEGAVIRGLCCSCKNDSTVDEVKNDKI